MKEIKILATFLCVGFFIFKPTGTTQIVQPIIAKETENKALKAKLDIKEDSIMLNLKKMVYEVKNQRVVYITRWRTKPADTVYMPSIPDNCDCDTVYFVVKKNNRIKQLITGKKNDTIPLQ